MSDLENQLVTILSRYVGETGISEGAVEVLERIAKNHEAFKATEPLQPLDQIAIYTRDSAGLITKIEQGHVQALQDNDQVSVVIYQHVEFATMQVFNHDIGVYGEELDLTYDKQVTAVVDLANVRFLARDDQFSEEIPF